MVIGCADLRVNCTLRLFPVGCLIQQQAAFVLIYLRWFPINNDGHSPYLFGTGCFSLRRSAWSRLLTQRPSAIYKLTDNIHPVVKKISKNL